MYFSSGIPTKIYNWSQHRDHHGTGSDVQRARIGSDAVNSAREPYSKNFDDNGKPANKICNSSKINYFFRCPTLK